MDGLAAVLLAQLQGAQEGGQIGRQGFVSHAAGLAWPEQPIW
jgi:hypothetical protein